MQGLSFGRIPEHEEYPVAVKVWANDAMANVMILAFTVIVEKTYISRTQQKRV